MIGKYRKKPVIVEAFRWDGQNEGDIAKLVLSPRVYFEIKIYKESDVRMNRMIIHTLEGKMKASPGDWIIRGIKGEFYPCKPDIFEATYELVEESKRKASARRGREE